MNQVAEAPALQAAQTWRVGDSELSVREEGPVLAEDHLVQAFPMEAWAELGLTISRTPATPAGLWNVSAGRRVGVARLQGDSSYAPQVCIEPKFEGADIFFLADHAWGRNRDLLEQSRLEANLAPLRTDPAACLLSWFLADLSTFTRRSLRHDYILRQEVFTGRVRGRLLLSQYARRHLPRAQAQRVPCQFFEFTRDNLANRILKHTLRRVAQMIPEVRIPEARRALRAQSETISPYFSAVGDQDVRRDDFNRLRLRGPLRHYQPIIEKSRAMLQRTYLSTELGTHVQSAFLWDMSLLFQEAIRGVLGRAGLVLDRKRGTARFCRANGQPIAISRVDPDYVLRIGSNTTVLDAKYKETGVAPGDESFTTEVLPSQRIRVRRSDIYQLIAYSRHAQHRTGRVALIYPVVLQAGEVLPTPHRVLGFAEEVSILFMDIGGLAQQSLPQFISEVEALLVANIEPSSH